MLFGSADRARTRAEPRTPSKPVARELRNSVSDRQPKATEDRLDRGEYRLEIVERFEHRSDRYESIRLYTMLIP